MKRRHTPLLLLVLVDQRKLEGALRAVLHSASLFSRRESMPTDSSEREREGEREGEGEGEREGEGQGQGQGQVERQSEMERET